MPDDALLSARLRSLGRAFLWFSLVPSVVVDDRSVVAVLLGPVVLVALLRVQVLLPDVAARVRLGLALALGTASYVAGLAAPTDFGRLGADRVLESVAIGAYVLGMARWASTRTWPEVQAAWQRTVQLMAVCWVAVAGLTAALLAFAGRGDSAHDSISINGRYLDLPSSLETPLFAAVTVGLLWPLFRLWGTSITTRDALDQPIPRSSHPVG